MATGLPRSGLVQLLIWANVMAREKRCFVVWRKELRD
jgi:hypothetical protein